ncbi:MAG: transcriptional regulator/sugar kinase [Ferruginibacter sp.]|nr:transcriptional regulator/sugar kinase [Ferruginibacter sp.]
MNDLIVCGVDIGGSHITAALVNLNTGIILQHTLRRMEVNAGGTKDAILSSWCSTIKDCFDANKMMVSKVGIAMPGPFDYEAGISLVKGQDKFDQLYGVNVKIRLASGLDIPFENITIVNDALCFLKGELSFGVAKNCSKVLGITLGTGFGSALYGGVTTDANLWCRPFMNGIAEDYFSTRWFVKRYYELSKSPVADVKELLSRIDACPFVINIFSEFAANLADFLLPVVIQDQIEMVVIGGNISKAFNYFSDKLKNEMNGILPGIQIVRSTLGESAALMGAANSFNTFKNEVPVYMH